MQLDSRIVDAFFLLLRAGLWNREVEPNTVFPLSVLEWKQLFALSQAHTVQGVMFDGMQYLATAHHAPKDLYIHWMVLVEKIGQRNRKMNQVLEKQYTLFAQQDIYPILLKGQYLAAMYTDPLRRVCGDVDWWFTSVDEFNRANSCMEKLGMSLIYPTLKTANYTFDGIEMDHHQQMIDIYNPFIQSYLKRLQTLEQERQTSLSLGSVDIRTASPLLGIVQVNVHILKHLLSFGIGLRQLCDSARLYHSLRDTYDSEELLAIYRKLGIYKWIQVLHEILHKDLGIEACSLPQYVPGKISSSWMMNEILTTGNFGFHDARYRHAEQVGVRKAVKRRILNHMWQYLPFAPMEALSFPVVHFMDRLKNR